MGLTYCLSVFFLNNMNGLLDHNIIQWSWLKSDWVEIRNSPPWAIDSLGFVTLLKMGSSLSAEEFSVKAPATYGESLSAQVVDEQVCITDQMTSCVFSQANYIFFYLEYGLHNVVILIGDNAAMFTLMLLLGSLIHLLLAPNLSQRSISGSLLKYLSKLQVSFLKVDEEPAIRTNTTILLGNISSYLDEGRISSFRRRLSSEKDKWLTSCPDTLKINMEFL
ncbi:hypothetical protein DKX38_018571 [Salix brachista]|uniref:Uncharacterized protein n=1 Tax=Salix brachista TaxID=2182728 RepID=A0A5N5KNI5_9ROSI|nr:hypothetical protein DKX38_018571 [Salix brachista]